MDPRILLIVPDPTLNSMLQLLLQRDSFEVTATKDAQEGMAEAQRTPPDVILLDISAPESDDWSAWEQLWPTLDLPLILLTSGLSGADAARGLLSGADLCLTKPFRMHELTTSIDTLLRQRARAREMVRVAHQVWLPVKRSTLVPVHVSRDL